MLFMCITHEFFHNHFILFTYKSAFRLPSPQPHTRPQQLRFASYISYARITLRIILSKRTRFNARLWRVFKRTPITNAWTGQKGTKKTSRGNHFTSPPPKSHTKRRARCLSPFFSTLSFVFYCHVRAHVYWVRSKQRSVFSVKVYMCACAVPGVPSIEK